MVPRQSQPNREVDDAEIAAYDEAGVVCLRGLIDPEWLEYLMPTVEDAMAAPGPYGEEYALAGTGRFFGDLSVWERHARFRDFVFQSPAVEIAAQVMRSDKVNFFYDQLLVKEPATKERTPWHQDQPYWAVDGWQVCSVWLPLDPVSKNSCVHYVRGSHRWGKAYNPHHFIDDSPYENTGLPELPDIDADPGRYEILSWDLEPGDCLVFQAMIVHAAPGNPSAATRRRAYSTRWTGDDATYAVRGGEVGFPPEPAPLAHGDPMDCPIFPRVWPRD